MKPNISEFSYGYAVTEELVTQAGATVLAAPTFPSLYEEGKKGGGYDVKVPLKGTPIFLQFKLSDCLIRTSSKEKKSGHVDVPYYRMHLRPLKHSDQHDLLLELEDSGESVFYIAPQFHEPAELNANYLGKTVVKNSAAFKPSAIGKLPDDEDHYVVFEANKSFGYLCSNDPIKVSKTSLKDGMRPAISALGIAPREIGREGIAKLTRRMLEVISSSESYPRFVLSEAPRRSARDFVEERGEVESAGYLALTYFGCELLVF